MSTNSNSINQSSKLINDQQRLFLISSINDLHQSIVDLQQKSSSSQQCCTISANTVLKEKSINSIQQLLSNSASASISQSPLLSKRQSLSSAQSPFKNGLKMGKENQSKSKQRQNADPKMQSMSALLIRRDEGSPFQRDHNKENCNKLERESDQLTFDQRRNETQKRRANHKKLQQKIIPPNQDCLMEESSQSIIQLNECQQSEGKLEEERDFYLSFGDKQFQNLLNKQQQIQSRDNLGSNQESMTDQIVIQQQKKSIDDENVTFQHYNSSKFTSNHSNENRNVINFILSNNPKHQLLKDIYLGFDNSQSQTNFGEGVINVGNSSEIKRNSNSKGNILINASLTDSLSSSSSQNSSAIEMKDKDHAEYKHEDLIEILKVESCRLKNLRDMLDDFDNKKGTSSQGGNNSNCSVNSSMNGILNKIKSNCQKEQQILMSSHSLNSLMRDQENENRSNHLESQQQQQNNAVSTSEIFLTCTIPKIAPKTIINEGNNQNNSNVPQIAIDLSNLNIKQNSMSVANSINSINSKDTSNFQFNFQNLDKQNTIKISKIHKPSKTQLTKNNLTKNNHKQKQKKHTKVHINNTINNKSSSPTQRNINIDQNKVTSSKTSKCEQQPNSTSNCQIQKQATDTNIMSLQRSQSRENLTSFRSMTSLGLSQQNVKQIQSIKTNNKSIISGLGGQSKNMQYSASCRNDNRSRTPQRSNFQGSTQIQKYQLINQQKQAKQKHIQGNPSIIIVHQEQNQNCDGGLKNSKSFSQLKTCKQPQLVGFEQKRLDFSRSQTKNKELEVSNKEDLPHHSSSPLCMTSSSPNNNNKDIERIFNIQIKDYSVNLSQSILSEITDQNNCSSIANNNHSSRLPVSNQNNMTGEDQLCNSQNNKNKQLSISGGGIFTNRILDKGKCGLMQKVSTMSKESNTLRININNAKNNSVIENDILDSETQNLKNKIESSISELVLKQKGQQQQDSMLQKLPSSNCNSRVQEDQVIMSQIFDQDMAIQESVRCSSINCYSQQYQSDLQQAKKKQESLEQFIRDNNSLQKYFLSLILVKEFSQRYPWLNQMTQHYLKNSNNTNILKEQLHHQPHTNDLKFLDEALKKKCNHCGQKFCTCSSKEKK